jgi:hypothetical protein
VPFGGASGGHGHLDLTAEFGSEAREVPDHDLLIACTRSEPGISKADEAAFL